MSQVKKIHQTRKEIIGLINDALETTWTEYEFRHGKELDIPRNWRTHIKYLVQKYRDNGWIVTRNIMISSESPRARRDYLIFLNPMFLRTPREIRNVSIRT